MVGGFILGFTLFWLSVLILALFAAEEVGIFASGSIYLVSIVLWRLALVANSWALDPRDPLVGCLLIIARVVAVVLGVVLLVKVVALLVM